MEKRGEGKVGIPVLALAKCLLVSYVLTLLLLCLLALLLYKLHLTEGIVTIAIPGREENGKAEIPMGSFRGSGIFCDPGGGVGADQDTGDCIRQFLLDYHDIVRGRGDTGRNVRVKYRNGQEFNGF